MATKISLFRTTKSECSEFCVNAVSEGQWLFILLSMATGGLRGVADGNVEWKDR